MKLGPISNIMRNGHQSVSVRSSVVHLVVLVVADLVVETENDRKVFPVDIII